jgi:hypothetical protein
MPYRVAVVYPPPLSLTLDARLEQLAAQHGGTWFGSGVGLVPKLADRDIDFQFASQVAAEGFARACRAIPCVQVRAIHAD